MGMDLGLILTIRQLRERPEPLAQVYADYLSDAELAEELGFDFVHTSEHHFSPDAWSPSQFPILAFIAARTRRMRLGTNVFVLPLHNPVRVAEDLATLDILSNGRVDFMVGSGSIEDEFSSLGVDVAKRWSLMWEGLEIIRRSFTEDAFDHAGPNWTFPNLRMTTKPVQRPFPLYVAGVGPKLMERAGREGYHLQGGGQNVDIYRQAVRDAGRDPDAYNHQLYTMGFCAESQDRAWALCEESYRSWRRIFQEDGRNWITPQVSQLATPLPVRQADLPTSLYPWMPMGTPDDMLRALEPRLRVSTVTHFGLSFRQAGMRTQDVHASMRLYAKEVMPVLRQWGRTPIR